MIDLLKYRYVYLLISALVLLPGLAFMALGGLKPGIDFTGGTELAIVMPAGVRPSTSAVERLVASVSYSEKGQTVHLDDAHVQQVRDDRYPTRQEYLIRTRDIGASVAAQNALLTSLKADYGAVQSLGFTTVSGTVAADTTTRAIQAIIVAAIAILLYMAWAFRKLPHPFVYGGAAIAALLHDVLVVLSVFAIGGFFFNIRIDSLFVPAVLTVIGFSVHDTIVVFDRIRENMGRQGGEARYRVVNDALLQTLGRSLSTSLTVVLTLLALLLFGGESIHTFALTLLVGIVSGTYSSIFNATPLAVMWETGEFGRLLNRVTKRRPRGGRHTPSPTVGARTCSRGAGGTRPPAKSAVPSAAATSGSVASAASPRSSVESVPTKLSFRSRTRSCSGTSWEGDQAKQATLSWGSALVMRPLTRRDRTTVPGWAGARGRSSSHFSERTNA